MAEKTYEWIFETRTTFVQKGNPSGNCPKRESLRKHVFTAMSESIAMFYDPAFEPIAYVDTLFQTILKQNLKAQHPTYSQANLSKLSNDISNLTTHLDYYTNELSATLKEKLDLLEQNSGQVVSEGGTRLEYQVDVLRNALLSLESELKEGEQDLKVPIQTLNEGEEDPSVPITFIKEGGEELKDPIQTLIQLKQVKSRIAEVLKHLNFINEILNKNTTGYDGIVTIDQFKAVLDRMIQLVKMKDEKVLGIVDDLIGVGELFSSTPFGVVYREFVRQLASETR